MSIRCWSVVDVWTRLASCISLNCVCDLARRSFNCHGACPFANGAAKSTRFASWMAWRHCGKHQRDQGIRSSRTVVRKRDDRRSETFLIDGGKVCHTTSGICRQCGAMVGLASPAACLKVDRFLPKKTLLMDCGEATDGPLLLYCCAIAC